LCATAIAGFGVGAGAPAAVTAGFLGVEFVCAATPGPRTTIVAAKVQVPATVNIFMRDP
jgi:hypothetical protein